MSDSDCPDCYRQFLARAGIGSCPKCAKLNAIGDPKSTEYKDAENLQQCFMCGIVRRHGMDNFRGSRLCGSSKCHELANSYPTGPPTGQSVDQDAAPPPIQSSAKTLAASQRSDLLRQRLRLPAASNSSGQGQTAGRETTGFDEPKGLVGWQVRTKSSIDHNFGGAVNEWPLSAYMSDIHLDILQVMNGYWTRGSLRVELQPDEVIMRWSGNQTFAMTDTMTLSFGDLYNRYNTPGQVNASIGPRNAPTIFAKQVTGKKCPCMFIDMFVDMVAYNGRISSTIDDSAGYSSPSAMLRSTLMSLSKRPRSNSSTLQHGGPAKKVTGMFNMTSEFRPRERVSSVHVLNEKTKVKFNKIVSAADNISGSATLLDLNETVEGLLSPRPFSNGTMKVAYDFYDTTARKQYVLKRFFRISEDAEVDLKNPGASYVDPTEHQDKIIEEAHRLSEATWFLKDFFDTFKKAKLSVAIDRDIQFATAFLLQELNYVPSKASGLPTDYDGVGMMWLVEDKRPMAVTKFSGTLQHKSGRHDLTSQTVYAFAHFVYLKSKGTTVFADIQGTLTNINGSDIMILFDLMTHTTSEDSGVGDWGKAGIQSFLADHKCGDICKALGLDQMSIKDGEIAQVDDQDDKEEGEVEES